MKNVICHTVSFQELNSENVLVQAVLNTIKVEGVFGLYVDYLYPLEGSSHDVSLKDANLFKRRIEDYAQQVDLVIVKY